MQLLQHMVLNGRLTLIYLKGEVLAKFRLGDPISLEVSIVDSINWDLAIDRILEDKKSDFIYAPHLDFLYKFAKTEIINETKSKLKKGEYYPSEPITIEVPKSFRVEVAAGIKRFGPNYSRPGSILLPFDRLVYQAISDEACHTVRKKTDSSRSFSHQIIVPPTNKMFEPTRKCWSEWQNALQEKSKEKTVRYILKLDIANYFGSINQHMLINTLSDAKFSKHLLEVLESMLIIFTGERSSRGILQGIFPSDLFGNFYMAPVDRYLKEKGYLSCRYVDDLYVFLKSVDDGNSLLIELIPYLRSYDLVLNEAKCKIIPKSALVTEEPDLQMMFEDAIDEVRDLLDGEDLSSSYGFQSDWEDDDDSLDEDDYELKATEKLFDVIDEYPGNEEAIERFCLPLFTKFDSDYAVEHVLNSLKKRASMTQIYCSYLSHFVNREDVLEKLFELISDEIASDWQKMWVLAALIRNNDVEDDQVRLVINVLKDANRHESLRAVAAIFVGFHGDIVRRKELGSIYKSSTNYIKAAIYFSSIKWPKVERSNARANWTGSSDLNRLMTIAFDNHKSK